MMEKLLTLLAETLLAFALGVLCGMVSERISQRRRQRQAEAVANELFSRLEQGDDFMGEAVIVEKTPDGPLTTRKTMSIRDFIRMNVERLGEADDEEE